MLTQPKSKSLVNYKWERKADGNYVIFSVPILSTYFDSNRKDLKAITEDDLRATVANFYELREKNSFLPRVHLGHHGNDGVSNNKDAGFLDNLKLQGNVVYADLDDVPEGIFKQIYNNVFPYRSAEYNIDSKSIDSLALLQSRAPFFKFPLLRLEKFQANRNSVVILFQEDEMQKTEVEPNSVAPTQEKYADDATKNVDDKEKVKFEDKPAPDPLGALSEKIDKLLQMIATMCEQKAAPAPTTARVGGIDPSSVAYQQTNQYAYYQQQMNELQKQITKISERGENAEFLSELEAIVETNPVIHFASEREHLLTLDSREQKQKHLRYLKNQKKLDVHQATQFVESLRVSNDPVIAKFQNESPKIHKFVRQLNSDYEEAVKKSAKFAAAWPSKEKFLEHCVSMEKQYPGYIEKEILRS